jgi:hypothetical protein
MFNNLFILFCLLNVLFWGFFSHKEHCKLASKLGVKQCPPHWVHVYVMAPIFLLLALYAHQGSSGLF